MKFRFHPDAKKDLDQAASYYDDRRQGLGDEYAMNDEYRVSQSENLS